MRISGETNQQNVFVNQTTANADKTAPAKDKNPDPQKMQGDCVVAITRWMESQISGSARMLSAMTT